MAIKLTAFTDQLLIDKLSITQVMISVDPDTGNIFNINFKISNPLPEAKLNAYEYDPTVYDDDGYINKEKTEQAREHNRRIAEARNPSSVPTVQAQPTAKKASPIVAKKASSTFGKNTSPAYPHSNNVIDEDTDEDISPI